MNLRVFLARCHRRRCSHALLAVFLLLNACSRRPVTLAPQHPPSRPPVPRRAAAHLGYTIQAGAFAKVENAARLAESLQSQGLDAAYYASDQGLFRVRFGDFPTKDAARRRAETLRAAGLIQEFYLVMPEDAPPELLKPKDEEGLRANLAATAASYLGVPYLWGGTTGVGFDCSGLAMAVYRLNGLKLPRSSKAQHDAGSPVPLEEARMGDLLFFTTDGSGNISHVGIYMGKGSFIHAPRKGQSIRKDQLSDRYYRKSFLGARSYV